AAAAPWRPLAPDRGTGPARVGGDHSRFGGVRSPGVRRRSSPAPPRGGARTPVARARQGRVPAPVPGCVPALAAPRFRPPGRLPPHPAGGGSGSGCRTIRGRPWRWRRPASNL
ncbi:MAG: hypothetical protein AVDCRST_MAG10-848, partial [uncultured Acidimicrobiales bacterium]